MSFFPSRLTIHACVVLLLVYRYPQKGSLALRTNVTRTDRDMMGACGQGNTQAFAPRTLDGPGVRVDSALVRRRLDQITRVHSVAAGYNIRPAWGPRPHPRAGSPGNIRKCVGFDALMGSTIWFTSREGGVCGGIDSASTVASCDPPRSTSEPCSEGEAVCVHQTRKWDPGNGFFVVHNNTNDDERARWSNRIF